MSVNKTQYACRQRPTGLSVLLTLIALGESVSFFCGRHTAGARLGASEGTSSCDSSLKSALVGFKKNYALD